MAEPTGVTGALGSFIQNFAQAHMQRKQADQQRAASLMQLAQQHAHIADTTPRSPENDPIIQHSREQVGALMQQADKIMNQKHAGISLLSKIPGISHALGLNKKGGQDGTPQPSMSTTAKDQVLGHLPEHETSAPLPTFGQAAPLNQSEQAPPDQQQPAPSQFSSGLPPQDQPPDVTGQTPEMEQPPSQPVDTTGQPGFTSGIPAQPGASAQPGSEGGQLPPIGRSTPLPKKQAPSIMAGASSAEPSSTPMSASEGTSPINTVDRVNSMLRSVPTASQLHLSDSEHRALTSKLVGDTIQKWSDMDYEIERARRAGQNETANKLDFEKRKDQQEFNARNDQFENTIAPQLRAANVPDQVIARAGLDYKANKNFNLSVGSKPAVRIEKSPDGVYRWASYSQPNDGSAPTFQGYLGEAKGSSAQEAYNVKFESFLTANKPKYTKKDGTVDEEKAKTDFAKQEQEEKGLDIEKKRQAVENAKQQRTARGLQIQKLKEYNGSKTDKEKQTAATGLLKAARDEAKARVNEDPSLKQEDVMRQILARHVIDGKAATEAVLQSIIGKTEAATPQSEASAAFQDQTNGMEKPPAQKPKGTPVTP